METSLRLLANMHAPGECSSRVNQLPIYALRRPGASPLDRPLPTTAASTCCHKETHWRTDQEGCSGFAAQSTPERAGADRHQLWRAEDMARTDKTNLSATWHQYRR